MRYQTRLRLMGRVSQYRALVRTNLSKPPFLSLGSHWNAVLEHLPCLVMLGEFECLGKCRPHSKKSLRVMLTVSRPPS